jgi:hypothetical protein
MNAAQTRVACGTSRFSTNAGRSRRRAPVRSGIV